MCPDFLLMARKICENLRPLVCDLEFFVLFWAFIMFFGFDRVVSHDMLSLLMCVVFVQVGMPFLWPLILVLYNL